ncbi:MAG: NAD-dependent epimerase/dehydratase family protein [Bacillaceae bacterium]|nr:NAD-dependent epimerase/dehydratase family protein [Bacillaceae bacterium]
MEKIVVTGGAGFIGSHVVDLLVDAGKQVLIIDNFSTGSRKNINKSELVTVAEIDIRDREALVDVFSQNNDISGVVHLAAQSKVTPSIERPDLDASINIQGTINVLQASEQQGIKRFIYASSAAVYGQTTDLPIKETSVTAPLSPYGVSKLAGEEYVKAYARLYEMEVYALRFANVYGPRQTAATEAGVITIFVEQLLKGTQPTIHGDGQQTRDFVYVKDVANAILACLSSTYAKNNSPVFHVSSGLETSIEQLLTELCSILNVQYAPIHEEERLGDIKYSYLDHSYLTSTIGWRCKTALKQGLVDTLHYYKTL